MQSTQALIMFDWFGEGDLEIYLLPNAPEWLENAHHALVNASSETPEALRVMDAISKGDYIDPDDEICGTWQKYRITDTLTCSNCQIIYTGFVP